MLGGKCENRGTVKLYVNVNVCSCKKSTKLMLCPTG